MWIQDPADPFQVGVLVKLRRNGRRAKVIGYCGALGPKGAKVYGIMFSRKPFRYTEVMADQLELWQPDEPAAPADQVEATPA